MAGTTDWDQIIVDPGVSRGREKAVRGTGISVSTVLHLLARMSDEDEVISYFSSFSSGRGTRDLSREDIRACVRYAASLAERRDLSPPAAARFARDELRASGITEEQSRLWIPEILESYSNGLGRQDLLPQHDELSDEINRTGLEYAAALAADENLSPVAESAEQRNLRDRLSDEDLRLTSDFCKYHLSIGLVLILPTPEEWFERWKQTVERVEEEYTNDIHELTNELGARDLLEQLTSMLTPRGQNSLRSVIQPWDARYEAATRLTSTTLMGNEAPWRPRRWWWYRVPFRFGSRLAEDLANRGINDVAE